MRAKGIRIAVRYVQRFRDAKGRERVYLRMPGAKRVPLPPIDDPDRKSTRLNSSH